MSGLLGRNWLPVSTAGRRSPGSTRKQRYSSVPPFGASGRYGRSARNVLNLSPTRSGPGAGTPVEVCAEWVGGAGDGAGPATRAVAPAQPAAAVTSAAAPATDLSPVRSRGPMGQRYFGTGVRPGDPGATETGSAVP